MLHPTAFRVSPPPGHSTISVEATLAEAAFWDAQPRDGVIGYGSNLRLESRDVSIDYFSLSVLFFMLFILLFGWLQVDRYLSNE